MLTNQEVPNGEGIAMTSMQGTMLLSVVDTDEQCLSCTLALLVVRRSPVQFADLHSSRNCVFAYRHIICPSRSSQRQRSASLCITTTSQFESRPAGQ